MYPTPMGWRRAGRTSAVLMTAAIVALVADSGGAAAQLASHKALYEMQLKTAETQTNIVGARGVMSVDWTHSCEGWTVNQRLRIEMELQSSSIVATEVAFSSFESEDGLTYRFTSRTTTNGRVVDEFRGTAERPEPGSAGIARYAVPNDVTLPLPAGTVFPMEHTRHVLEAAQRGERTILRRFFDGPRPEESPFDANALILSGPQPAEEGPAAGLGPITDYPWWPMRIAFFPATGQAAEPDFELEAKAQDNGVVREFVFDYGDFAMTATLSQIEPIEEPSCGG